MSKSGIKKVVAGNTHSHRFGARRGQGPFQDSLVVGVTGFLGGQYR